MKPPCARWSRGFALAGLLMTGAALIRFLASPEAAPAITKAGLSPIPGR